MAVETSTASLLCNPDGRLALISPTVDAVRTAEGVAVGDPVTRVVEVYGSEIELLGDGSGYWLGVATSTRVDQYVLDIHGLLRQRRPVSGGVLIERLDQNQNQQCVS